MENHKPGYLKVKQKYLDLPEMKDAEYLLPKAVRKHKEFSEELSQETESIKISDIKIRDAKAYMLVKNMKYRALLTELLEKFKSHFVGSKDTHDKIAKAETKITKAYTELDKEAKALKLPPTVLESVQNKRDKLSRAALLDFPLPDLSGVYKLELDDREKKNKDKKEKKAQEDKRVNNVHNTQLVRMNKLIGKEWQAVRHRVGQKKKTSNKALRKEQNKKKEEAIKEAKRRARSQLQEGAIKEAKRRARSQLKEAVWSQPKEEVSSKEKKKDKKANKRAKRKNSKSE